MMLAFQACEYVAELDGLDENPRLYLLCMPGGSDTTVVSLRATMPMADRNASEIPVDDAEIIMKVNGEQVPLSVADESVTGMSADSRYTLSPVLPGDKVEISAAVEGLQPVASECTVPAAFPEHEIRFETVMRAEDGNMKTFLNVVVEFPETPEAGDCFGIRVYREEDVFGYDAGNRTVYRFMLPKGLDTDYYEYSISNGPFMADTEKFNLFSWSHINSMLIYDEFPSVDGGSRMEFQTNYEKNTYDEYYGSGHSFRYKVFLYRLSPELLRFVKANMVYNYNGGVLFAMAPPSYVYTNIRGGVGVLGGITCHETDWLPNVTQQ